MADNKTGYGNIFKTTFLFGFVQAFNILVKVGINKVVALLLGAEGLGIIGLFNTTINTIKTGAGLGINQSAVRDISEANSTHDKTRFSKTITVTNRVILFSSLFGIAITILLSPLLSKWQFGDTSFTLSFVALSLVVGIQILNDGQQAILKGMRQLRQLAKASIYGSLVGLVTAVPFYFFLGRNGIVPSLFISAISALFFSNMFVRRIEYDKVTLSIKTVVNESSTMVKMGIALMLVSFLGFAFDLVVSSYISYSGCLADVGYYHAGTTIVASYFGIVITAMSTDYYPRISAVNKDNSLLQEEMIKQSETGLVMIFPLVILFVFLSPFFIDILYSKDFYATNDYTDYAMIGTVIIVVSNCMGMILLAKQASNIFILSVLIQRIIMVGLYLLSYKYLGLLGLGLSYVMHGVIHLLLTAFILIKFYGIRLAKRVYGLLSLIIMITIMTIFARKIDILIVRYSAGGALFVTSMIVSYYYMKYKMNMDVINVVVNKILKK